MNTILRLDTYLAVPLRPSRSAAALAAAAARSSTHAPQLTPASASATACPYPPQSSSSSSSSAPSISLTRPTPAPSPTSTPPRTRRELSAQRRRRRRRPPTGASIKLPPPTTPLLVRIALAFWSILLSFWRSLVGDTRAVRTLRHKRAVQLAHEKASTGGGLTMMERIPDLGLVGGLAPELASASSDEGEGSASEAEPSDREWVDPVTRAPPDGGSADDVAEPEFIPGTRRSSRSGSSRPRTPTDTTFSFRLRSAQNKDTETITGSLDLTPPDTASPVPVSAIVRSSTPASILTSSPPRRSPRILANPLAATVLDPSVPSVPHRSVTPTSIPPVPRATPFHLQKTLILDLDETLIHSTSRPIGSSSAGGGMLGLGSFGPFGSSRRRRRGEGHTVEVVLNGRSTTYHVYKRPYVDFFLKKVASWYTLVIFTASMPEYADPVIDWLDNGRGLFAKRLYRESCHLQPNGSYIKDLADVEPDLGKVCFMDNSPISYNWNKANALPIEGWTSDPNDEALLQSIPVLDSLRFVTDVRHILGIRGFA